MQKIPTVFMRDPNNRGKVTDEVNPECQWVLDGEGVATRKFDGTCVMMDSNGTWWGRREVKPGKKAPDNFRLISTDENTGKSMGWEPIAQTPYFKYWRDAVVGEFNPGTYELVGPKINGNPEKLNGHRLVRHGSQTYRALIPNELTVDYIKGMVSALGRDGIEGIVWHHPDGRMAKLKARDL